MLGVRRWRELVIEGKNGEVLFDKPKPTVGCSANGRKKKKSTLALGPPCFLYNVYQVIPAGGKTARVWC
jgi:hypothetical protein